MADILDQADDAQEVFMREAMSRIHAPTVAHGIGMCLNCGAEVPDDARWCDAPCRDDYEQEQARRRHRQINALAYTTPE